MPPIRTCVVCREKTAPDDLVRLALAPDGTAVIDFRGKLPGRGAWAHPACLPTLERKPGMLKRGLKVLVPTADWSGAYRSALLRALEDGLSLAQSGGALVGGAQMLTAALREDRLEEVVLAADIAPGSLKKLRAAAAERVVFTTIHLDTGALGERVGKGPRAALGIRRSRAAIHLQRQLRRLRALG
jgi:hypothetical protein